MTITTRHREVEARFRELIETGDLPTPDDVAYEPEAVVFFWNAPRVAVAVDFDGEPVPVPAGAVGTAGAVAPAGAVGTAGAVAPAGTASPAPTTPPPPA